MNRYKLNPIPFANRPRRAKKAAFISVKNDIRRAAPILGGKFTTHNYIHGDNGWLDIYFLGSKAPNFYNVSLCTTKYAYVEAVKNEAMDRSYALVADTEPSWLDRSYKDPTTGRWITPAYEQPIHPEFEGLTRFEWEKSQREAIANSGTIQVFQSWSVHHDYSSGIGLHATIDVPSLTIEHVNAFIEQFMRAPMAYRDPNPLSYRFDEIRNWGMESNAVAYPWEWPADQRADDLDLKTPPDLPLQGRTIVQGKISGDNESGLQP
jgi:hypothetical protein